MASFLTPDETVRYLASRTSSVYTEPCDSELVLFTTPPSMASTDGSDGVEVAGYDRPLVDFGTPTPGGAGMTGQVANASGVSIPDMPVASGDIHGYGFANAATHEIWFVNDAWVPTQAFAVGGNFYAAPGELVLYAAPAPAA